KKAKEIFSTILALMGEGGYLKLDKEPDVYHEFVAEKYLDEFNCSIGKGYCISLAHYFEINGDLAQDPEVMFFVMDERTDEDRNINKLNVYPMAFQQALPPKYEEFLKVDKGVTLVAPKAMRSCCSFVNGWLLNVIDQQSIEI
ncbi:MAG TPA: hypothetical protein VEB40_16790, partial [Flavipsychrobacter sp.]|nr:hypothetical protein [Flavipsychrobacter sp.]